MEDNEVNSHVAMVELVVFLDILIFQNDKVELQIMAHSVRY